MVEKIPSFRAKLELQVLPDIEALEEREVDIANPGPWMEFRLEVP